MTFASNPGFLAVAFIEGSAAFILLVLYCLLIPSFSARFFKYWLVGWTVYVAHEGVRVFSLWRGGLNQPSLGVALSLTAALFFFAAVLECLGLGKRLRYFWPASVIIASALLALSSVPDLSEGVRQAEALLECALYISAGWVFWREKPRHRGVGWALLAGGLILRGLHGLARAGFAHSTGLFYISFQGLFAILMGIAMAVLVLEAGSQRTEDLNEKLRRLALITLEATQTQDVDDALQNVLRHLVESLSASHGLVLLFDKPGNPKSIALRASVGFSDRFRRQAARFLPDESWVQEVVLRKTPVASYHPASDLEIRKWMEAERLATLVLVRVPGDEGPLGMLGIASATPRSFEGEEEHYLVNVANLLALTIQNVSLLESAAASRRQWVDTFDSIDDLILVHSLDGRIVRVNRALSVRLQADPLAIVGRPVVEVLRQGPTGWSRCPYCEGAAGKAEEVDPSFGGYFLATDSALHDSQGGRLGTIHVLKDFTGHRQAENKFRTLFEKVQEGVFVSTPEGLFLDFNDAFMRILGYDTHEELLQADIPAQLYVDEADRERRQRLLFDYGEVVDFEFQFRRRDGEIRTAHESSFATRDESGAVVAYQGFLLDITEHKQAEIDIRRRNRALLALNAIGELLGQSQVLEEGLTASLLKVIELFGVDAACVYLLDESSQILKRAAAVGYRSEYGRRIPPVAVSSALLDQIRQARATLLSGALPALPEEIHELHRSEGIQSSQVVVLWAQERIIGILVVGSHEMRPFSTAELNLLSAVGNQIANTIDKSVLLEKTREAYDTLRRTQEQLLQSEKMAAVGQLISGVAHELNNPLTAILGYSQLLDSPECMQPRGAAYLQKLHKQAQRMHHIVQNLLSFARQHKPQRAPVNLNQIVEDTLVLREFDIKRNNIVIHRNFDPDLPSTAGDFHQLEQVFLNILNNAVDAIQETGKPGEISIRTEVVGDRLRVEFTDNGPGVTNAHRIFDPFYTTKAVGKGTGLGLSICYGIVKEHGGEIQVRNSGSRGATFSIVLPLQSADVSAAEPESQQTQNIAGTVLLLEHEDSVLQLEQEILLAAGAGVRQARSAEDAIEILQRSFIDAVVLDLNMAGEMPVTFLYQWIEQNRPGLATRVVFTASTANEDGVNHILRKTACPFLAKPFQIAQFRKAVQSVLTAPVPSSVKS